MITNLVRSLRRSRTTVAMTAVAGMTAGLISAGLGITGNIAQAAPASPMGTSSVLQSEDFSGTGLAADSAALGTRGDQPLGDAGRFDEGCLWEKTMRNITGAKAFPAPGTAAAYVDVAWQSSTDKDVWLNESIAKARTKAATDRYVAILTSEIKNVTNCEQDPAHGDHYGAAHKLRVGTATLTYYLDYHHDGSTDGGGVAIIRDENRFGFVGLMSGRSAQPGGTLRTLAVRAAKRLS